MIYDKGTPSFPIRVPKLSSVPFEKKFQSVGLSLGPTDWNFFSNGTEESFGTLIGKDGVPFSYIIRDDNLRPTIGPTTTRASKIFWCAKFTGPSFCQDQNCVWGY